MSGSWTDPEGSPAPTEAFPAVGRHGASQGPTTGPIHRIPLPPRGRHQEKDLEPKAWPWWVVIVVASIGFGGAGYVWGQDIGAVAALEQVRAESSPAPAVTFTETASARPLPRITITETATAKALPRPTVTVTETSAPAPGQTVYRTASPTPRPTVTKTRTVEVMVCFELPEDSFRLEEIDCP